MATIKAYSDISQSKKLADILPLESADMNWHELPSIGYFVRAFPYKHDNGATEGIFPCWSLAALLSVLPYPCIEQNYKGKWTCRVEHGNTTYLWEDSNSVDACYEMIIKLHELNLL